MATIVCLSVAVAFSWPIGLFGLAFTAVLAAVATFSGIRIHQLVTENSLEDQSNKV